MCSATQYSSSQTHSEGIITQLYDSKNIDQLEWPETVEGQYAKNFLAPLVKNGISHYINNIDAAMYVLKLGDLVFPVTVTTENYSNSWVCSPYAHYISYGKEFAKIVGNPFLTGVIKSLISIFGKIAKSGKINSVVYGNNWMFSTDLYLEEIHPKYIDHLIAALTHHFPNHAIVLRSLNKITTPHLMKILEEKKFYLIASRYIFITDTQNESVFRTQIIKSDMKLWNNNSYKILEENDVREEDYEELLKLYKELYIFRHSPLQPQYNIEYFKLFFKNQLLKFKILKSNDGIEGMAGYYRRGNVMTCPIFGFRKECTDSNKVYRLLNTALLLEAQKEGLIFNQSAGASFFKSIRKAEGCLEHMAVYPHHLPSYQKHIWSALKFFIHKVGSKYMKNY
jgi:hypothetical protein